MNIEEIMAWRYSTKKFDASFQLTEEQIKQTKTLLRLSPSSVNVQPWHFVMATTPSGKARIAKATAGDNSYNQSKVLDSALVVVFCARLSAAADYQQQLVDKEVADGRIVTDELKKIISETRAYYISIHQNELNDEAAWLAKQVYLNMGGFLMGVAAMGLDAVPLEGVDTEVLNQEFDLPAKGYTALAAVAVGRRHPEDKNAPERTAKSRLDEAVVITHLD